MVPSPAGGKTRPTSSLARQALFNILPSVDGYAVLDLFAGSGIMGIEALSRGAASLQAVENSKAQAKVLVRAYQELGLSAQVRLLPVDVLSLPTRPLPEAGSFDLIYADPPFTQEYPDLRPFLKWLSPRGVAVFEAPSRSLPAWAAEAADQRRYGESTLLFFNPTC
jgi:16S rRNA (guanine966-N2)-methyltransferase